MLMKIEQNVQGGEVINMCSNRANIDGVPMPAWHRKPRN